jgi:hypothetical protein
MGRPQRQRACPNHNSMRPDLDRMRDGFQYLFCRYSRAHSVTNGRTNHGKFVTTEPGDGVILAGNKAKTLRNAFEDGITGLMPKRIVYWFEFIQIQEQQSATNVASS